MMDDLRVVSASSEKRYMTILCMCMRGSQFEKSVMLHLYCVKLSESTCRSISCKRGNGNGVFNFCRFVLHYA
jgi:hypothetical protein